VLGDREPQPARSLYTTIDLDFQAAVEQALADAIATHPAAEYGAIVVLDPRNGAVRAMATYPSYDPQAFNPLRDDAATAIGALLNDPGQPLLNRATQGVYPSRLDLQADHLRRRAQQRPLHRRQPLQQHRRVEPAGRGVHQDRLADRRPRHHQPAPRRIVVSCNTCFYDVGYTIDNADNTLFPRIAKAFGLGQPTGIQGVAESAGSSPTRSGSWPRSARAGPPATRSTWPSARGTFR
jgi:penicillin-binding protein 2